MCQDNDDDYLRSNENFYERCLPSKRGVYSHDEYQTNLLCSSSSLRRGPACSTANYNDCVVTATKAIFLHKPSDWYKKTPVAVVGFQFKHSYFSQIFMNVTRKVRVRF